MVASTSPSITLDLYIDKSMVTLLQNLEIKFKPFAGYVKQQYAKITKTAVRELRRNISEKVLYRVPTYEPTWKLYFACQPIVRDPKIVGDTVDIEARLMDLRQLESLKPTGTDWQDFYYFDMFEFGVKSYKMSKKQQKWFGAWMGDQDRDDPLVSYPEMPNKKGWHPGFKGRYVFTPVVDAWEQAQQSMMAGVFDRYFKTDYAKYFDRSTKSGVSRKWRIAPGKRGPQKRDLW